MRAHARVVAESDGCGGTRLTTVHGESPLLFRRTGGRGGPGVTVHLVGGAAGPLRGDELRLDVTVGPGAELEIRSVAAQLALPGRADQPASRYEIYACVAAGATLRWLPEPLIAAAGCDHLSTTHVDVAAGGRLLWRDDLVCGRHGEQSGDVRLQTTIRYAERTLYRHDLSVGPKAPGWSGAAVLGSGRAIGAMIVAGPDSLPAAGPLLDSLPAAGPLLDSLPAAGPLLDSLPGAGSRFGDAAVLPLAGPGAVVTAVGADIRQVRAALDPLCRRVVAAVSAAA